MADPDKLPEDSGAAEPESAAIPKDAELCLSQSPGQAGGIGASDHLSQLMFRLQPLEQPQQHHQARPC